MSSSSAASRQIRTVTSQGMRETRTPISSQSHMTPVLSVDAVLGWLGTMVPGLRAAAVLDEHGGVLGGDPALAAAVASAARPAGGGVVRGPTIAGAVEVDAPVLDRLLRRGLPTGPGAVAGG